MSLFLYMDQHVRRAVTDGLRRNGVDVLTAFEDSHDRASDEEIVRREAAIQRVIFTQDEDYLAIARLSGTRDRLLRCYLRAHAGDHCRGNHS